MGKVYQFPTNKRRVETRAKGYSKDTGLLNELMETLILTYEDKIEELQGYKREIKALDGMAMKSPREVIKEVKALQKRFLEYGLTCNFFRFFTKENQEILYYNESSCIYVIGDHKMDQARRISVGEFISEFEGYPFTLNIEQAIMEIFDSQINQLETTITTLKNTQV